jgi:glycosyltransferase involved in cell wall biosynthesis
MNCPLVSIVITTKNEEKNIENCLRSIKEQTYESIEIIVVDNGSTDQTKKIAKMFTSLVFNKGPERSAQRNYGMIDIAKGTYVMFIDADMMLSPGLVKQCIVHMARSTCLALHIPEVILGKTYWCKVRRFERSFYDGTVIDGARFFLKDAFVQAGGFDESMSGPEDWDIDKKIKQKGIIDLLDRSPNSEWFRSSWNMRKFIEEHGVCAAKPANVIYHNETEFNLKKYLSKKGYYADSFNVYIKKWGQDDPIIRKQLGLWYRYLGVFVENGKWKKLLVNAHLAIGMYSLRILVGILFIARQISWDGSMNDTKSK